MYERTWENRTVRGKSRVKVCGNEFTIFVFSDASAGRGTEKKKRKEEKRRKQKKRRQEQRAQLSEGKQYKTKKETRSKLRRRKVLLVTSAAMQCGFSLTRQVSPGVTCMRKLL